VNQQGRPVATAAFLKGTGRKLPRRVVAESCLSASDRGPGNADAGDRLLRPNSGIQRARLPPAAPGRTVSSAAERRTPGLD
jgi:hypothetical protein